MYKKILTILFFMFLGNTVLAVPLVTTAAVPKNLHVYDIGGNTYVDLVPHGCAQTRYYLAPDHVKYDAIVSLLMAAQIANKEVLLRYDGCDSNSMGKIVGVYLMQ